ncbi:hypothetical protein GDO86_001444 [Hymenochirus boettgeri]|uniref:Uncharacterized protein n=1 Tax=Hymenochirus boettgeri TaxID=247094 RepID=A0A8T2KES2_9PIPI|nr:hypothetical protein GDO86_001444 [Hymenochirus boettgeri]
MIWYPFKKNFFYSSQCEMSAKTVKDAYHIYASHVPFSLNFVPNVEKKMTLFFRFRKSLRIQKINAQTVTMRTQVIAVKK